MTARSPVSRSSTCAPTTRPAVRSSARDRRRSSRPARRGGWRTAPWRAPGGRRRTARRRSARRRPEPALAEHRLRLEQRALAQHAVRPHIAEQREEVVQPHAGGEPPERDPVAAVQREEEGQGPDQVRRDPEQHAALPVGLEHQSQVAGLQVAQAAVHQAAGARAGARAEIVLLDQHRAEAAHGRVAGDAGPGDAAADHQQVGGLRRELARASPAAEDRRP